MHTQKYISRMRTAMLGVMLSFSILFMVPVGVSAQTTPSTFPANTSVSTLDNYTGSYCSTYSSTITNLSDLFKYFTCTLERLILPLMFMIAGLVFVWGTVKFIGSRDSAEREQGQQFMIWGVIGFAVMLSLFGLVRILGVSFKINNSTAPVVPNTTQISS